ncbi:GNAT family N-acetyltransferase [Salisediminibacterium selenitireducens]|uniref:GCN5-related N-acetyltransferase n=1 Tax=Bacillus selenitireducens (strain ATCC 700615 / DSM 15326 / MLS10) TaxID=439292 RepID=D6XX90_BACIE|nr:GNAT family N-acetyltransferase [Salisediminibacterium selenitireducens]ADH97947.1 GCN5-related N-acetyltransferase [[Bacillus] selenitireducens MLS10]
MTDILIRPMTVQEWPAVSAIYQAGLDTELATFETVVPSWDSWNQAHHETCRLIAEYGGTIAGWAALAPTSPRYAYRGVAEISIYIAPGASGLGVGRTLLNALIEDSEKAGFWTIQSAIFRENQASIHLHKKCGFRQIGYREQVAERHGVWHDIILMERRSPIVAASPSARPDPS